MKRKMPRKPRPKKAWFIIEPTGALVVPTSAHTKKICIDVYMRFRRQDHFGWQTFLDLGYRCVKCTITPIAYR